MCLTENGIPVDLEGVCCRPHVPLDLCPAVCSVSESLLGLTVEGALDCLEANEEFPLHTGRSRRGKSEWSRETESYSGLTALV